MTAQSADQGLPELFRRWLADILPGAIPAETVATCDDCAMCTAGPVAPELVSFRPDLKCCTFLPELPCFAVGRLLADTSPGLAAGQASVRVRLASGGPEVTPLGLARPPGRELLYHSGKTFGRSPELLCPHYLKDSGRCGIWPHREAVCATYFCKFRRGAVGRAFWRALWRLLSAVERTLAVWCVGEHGLYSEALDRWLARREREASTSMARTVLAGESGGAPSYQALWGVWCGREETYYQSCARLVAPLRWADLISLGGPELPLLASQTVETWRHLTSSDLPDAVRPGPYKVLSSAGATALVVGYSQTQPLELPRLLLELLPEFEGRSVSAALERLQARNITLTPRLVRKLVDHQLLVAVTEV